MKKGERMSAEQKDKIRISNKGKHRDRNNENNPKWKGDKVGYVALHAWVKRKLGKKKICYICSNDKEIIDLCNISGVYNRDFSNWTFMCRSCHNKMDCSKSIYTKEDLVNFENWVISEWSEARILSPVHLSRGDENELIKIFRLIKRDDVVYSTYRSHYHALLHGVSIEWLKKWILSNKSIHVMHKDPFIITSAIVGGNLSQAVGSAMAIKIKKEKRRVWVFCGDMTATLGIFNECYKYSVNHDLPIVFVISDNGLSTDTPTKEVWGMKETDKHWFEERPQPKIIYFKYKRELPHYGVGKFVSKIWENVKDDVRAKGI